MLSSEFVNPESSNPVVNPMYVDRKLTNPGKFMGSFWKQVKIHVTD